MADGFFLNFVLSQVIQITFKIWEVNFSIIDWHLYCGCQSWSRISLPITSTPNEPRFCRLCMLKSLDFVECVVEQCLSVFSLSWCYTFHSLLYDFLLLYPLSYLSAKFLCIVFLCLIHFCKMTKDNLKMRFRILKHETWL